MNEHEVILYVNAAAKTFTATARKPSARLAEVTAWVTQHGFSPVPIAKNVDKANAEALKKREMRRYKGQGFQYQYKTRPPL